MSNETRAAGMAGAAGHGGHGHGDHGHGGAHGHTAAHAHGSHGHGDHGHGGHGHGDHGHGIGHVVSMRVLVSVWLTLMVLTAVTVVAAQYRFGPMEVVVAMVIATIKGALVCMYFMHLRYDRPFHAFIFVSALGFVTLFISFLLMDAKQYAPEIHSLEADRGLE